MKKPFYCDLDGNWYSKISIVRILKKYGKNVKEYYDQHYKKNEEGFCKHCGKETKFVKFSYYKFCNVKCSGLFNKNSSKVWKNRTQEQKEDASRRAVATRRSRYTVEDMNKKREKTIQERYGMTYKEFKSMQLKKRFEKMNESELKQFFDNATSLRNCFKYHIYELNGEQVRTQGYERFVLDVLKDFFSENSIIVDQNVKVYYKDADGKTRRYYPDIIIDNFMFEVKSEYTLNLHKEDTLLKMEAALKEGYIPILVLWDINDSEMCEKDLIETISSQALTQEGRFNDYPFIGVGNKQTIAEVLGIHVNGL